MKTQPTHQVRGTTDTVESSRTPTGGAVDRTTARAGQRGGKRTQYRLQGQWGFTEIAMHIAARRDFPLSLPNHSVV